MAAAKSTATEKRNSARRSSRAWSKHSDQTGTSPGHRKTGRTKPSGKSVGGHAISKIRKDHPSPESFASQISKIDASRDTARRAAVRRERKHDAVRVPAQTKARVNGTVAA